MDKSGNIALESGLALVLLYVFANTVGLPHGLSYTFLLSPVILFFNWRAQLIKPYVLFLLLLTPFAFIHFFHGVSPIDYLQSSILLLGSWVFGVGVYQFLSLEKALPLAMKRIVLVNTILLPVALLAYFTPFKTAWWYSVPISPGLPAISRLMMLTYEASYYSLLLAPVVLYYILKVLFFKGYKPILMVMLLGIPLLLAFSLGVWAGIGISLILLFALHLKWLVLHKRLRLSFILISSTLVLSLVLLLLFYPDNPLFVRLQNIPSGSDTSARGRTYEAFQIAWLIAQEKSIWFGVGLGQIKLLGREIILNFYHYINVPEVVRIPNAAAETLAQFGIIGLALRVGAQVFLFWRTKVWSNFFRFSLFCFVFIYQFTGSFMVNIAEIAIWVMAFAPIAPEFDKAILKKSWQLPDSLLKRTKGGEYE